MTCLAALTIIALTIPTAEPVVFEREVKPILVSKCVKCHGGETTKSGLDLRTAASIQQGGDTGPAISGRDPAKSLLLEQITSGTMPPPLQNGTLRVHVF